MGTMLLMHRIETGGDNLDFLLMAKSIQAGRWGDILGWPRPAGYSFFILGVLALFGRPMDASPLFSLSGGAVYVLKFAGVAVFALSSVAVYAWARRVLGDRRGAFGLAMLFAANQHVAAWSSVIGAEALFILFAFLSLFLWESYAARDDASGRGWLWSFVAAAVACMFSKYQGLMVGAAFGPWVLLFRRRSRGAWAAGLVLLVFFLFSIVLMLIGNPFCLTHVVASDPYGYGERVGWLVRIGNALRTYTWSWPDLVVPKVVGPYGLLSVAGMGGLSWPFSILAMGLLLTGLIATLRKSRRPSHVFLACFYVLLFAWPDFLFRYLVPMLPFGLWFLIEGLRVVAKPLVRRVPSLSEGRFLSVLLGLLVVWSVAVNAFAGIKNWRNIVELRDLPAWAPERYRISREDDFADYIEGCQWIRDHLEPEAVVFVRKALFAEWASERRCAYYSAFSAPDELWAAMAASAERSPTYVLRDTFAVSSTYGRVREQLLSPLFRSQADGFSLVHRMDSGVEVHRIQPHGHR